MDRDSVTVLALVLILALTFPTMTKANCYEIDKNTNTDSNGSAKYVQCDYKKYSVIINCPLRLPLLSWTTLQKDTGDADTSSRNYKLDPQASSLNCQQTSDKPYSDVYGGYEVGRLTAIDLLDDDIQAALEANFMTNLIPQESFFNRTGAWRRTEVISECYREDYRDGILVISGALAGSNSDNDHFSSSHGLLKTPDRFWKLIYMTDDASKEGMYELWIMSNSEKAKASSLFQSREKLSNLFEILKNEDDELYIPIINKLKELVPDNVTRITLSYKSECYRRNG